MPPQDLCRNLAMPTWKEVLYQASTEDVWGVANTQREFLNRLISGNFFMLEL